MALTNPHIRLTNARLVASDGVKEVGRVTVTDAELRDGVELPITAEPEGPIVIRLESDELTAELTALTLDHRWPAIGQRLTLALDGLTARTSPPDAKPRR